MYSVYVTNKTNSEELYIRLQHEKLSIAIPSFHHDLDKLKDEKRNVSSYLIRWGFCLIPPQHTMSFAIDVATDGTKKYTSLYAHFKLWTMDYEMNCLRYGCLFVRKAVVPSGGGLLYLTQSNPKPLWITGKKGDALPPNIIKAGLQEYFGRIAGGTPCKVSVSGNQLSYWHGQYTVGELLRDTGHEFVQAKAGDHVPPRAVITSMSHPEGSLFLGMVGGQFPCSISTEGGKIKHFCYNSQTFQSGEILILTNQH